MPVDYSGRNMPGFTKKKPRDYKKCEAGDYFRFFGIVGMYSQLHSWK